MTEVIDKPEKTEDRTQDEYVKRKLDCLILLSRLYPLGGGPGAPRMR